MFSKFGPVICIQGGYWVFTKLSKVKDWSISLLDQEKDVT